MSPLQTPRFVVVGRIHRSTGSFGDLRGGHGDSVAFQINHLQTLGRKFERQGQNNQAK